MVCKATIEATFIQKKFPPFKIIHTHACKHAAIATH